MLWCRLLFFSEFHLKHKYLTEVVYNSNRGQQFRILLKVYSLFFHYSEGIVFDPLSSSKICKSVFSGNDIKERQQIKCALEYQCLLDRHHLMTLSKTILSHNIIAEEQRLTDSRRMKFVLMFTAFDTVSLRIPDREKTSLQLTQFESQSNLLSQNKK